MPLIRNNHPVRQTLKVHLNYHRIFVVGRSSRARDDRDTFPSPSQKRGHRNKALGREARASLGEFRITHHWLLGRAPKKGMGTPPTVPLASGLSIRNGRLTLRKCPTTGEQGFLPDALAPCPLGVFSQKRLITIYEDYFRSRFIPLANPAYRSKWKHPWQFSHLPVSPGICKVLVVLAEPCSLTPTDNTTTLSLIGGYPFKEKGDIQR